MTIENEPSAVPVSFERNIRPLFRAFDRDSMTKAFDLWSYTDVVSHQEAILDHLVAGSMPCDGAWPAEQVELVRQWIAAGSPA
ncbi:hypothetical protein [Lacisediminihabitans changchengi]|uniref:Uncharacterized protein n=1 Tax=Lacisediminihabitans changchengi TaxID=2787634 RepID=A0A934W4P7_9MICO|nr:hypothetical protein [Lacisediminihabitans changchengi]MBK4347700.1 hypothetical protein [Lacisediminihabitans changchengi]